MNDNGLLHKVCTCGIKYTTLASNPEHLCFFCQRDPKRRVPSEGRLQAAGNEEAPPLLEAKAGMNKAQYELAATLLDKAADEFSNHGCNDYTLPNTPENVELMRRAHEWNVRGDASQPFDLSISKDGTEIYTMDYYVMGFMAHLLREAAQ